ncbi:MAG: hypothetical protein ACO1N3_04370 [Gammaproteobacteria bacterium]
MALTIIFNGTSDTYHPNDLSYLEANQLTGIREGSHTLSFFADCIATAEEQKTEPLLSRVSDPSILIQNNDLIVIQGPDDTGTSVHNLIVTGLMAALNALMRDEQEINFVGFSRGSVEAIHMAHELQRIKDYLNNSSKDRSISALVNFICDGCYNPGTWATWRTNRINSYYKKALIEALKDPVAVNSLQNGLSNPNIKLRFNGMLLDPVPGLAEGTTLPSYIPWISSQHTTIAPMVDELTVTYMGDELSVGFRAVWVEASSESTTKVTHLHLPGYHGTANGNPVNHCPAETLAQTQNPFPYQNLRTVQKVYFYKLLQFAAKHGVKFKAPDHLEGRFLTPVYHHFLENINNIAAQNEYIRAQYKEISANIVHYRKTRDTYYIPAILGLGGSEHTGGERIIMTKSGPRSLADCFSFDIAGSKTYVNFDHFSLDFMTLLFPELSTSPADSPNQQEAMTYSGIHQIVTTRYTSPTPDMDHNTLIRKIEVLLAACQSHNLDDNLNTIILHETLDHHGILSNLVNLVPTKLADMLFSTNLNRTDKGQLYEIISQIINFKLCTLNEHELGANYTNLFEKKSAYIKTFRENMLAALRSQTHKTLANLLTGQEQLHYRASYQTQTTTPASSDEPLTTFNPWDYLTEAEEYYLVLHEFKTKLLFSKIYLPKEDYQLAMYRIDEAITLFSISCQNTLTKHGVDWHENMENLRVLQPWLGDITIHKELDRISLQLEQRTQKLAQFKHSLTTLQAQKAQVQKKLQDTKKVQASQKVQINTLQQRMQIIRETLQSRQPSDYHGFTLKILGSLAMILGMSIAVISASYLILGTAGLAAPVVGLIAGSGLATWGVFNLQKGALRQHDQMLAETFFPAVPGAR